jgi:hypothetical protein
MSFWIAAEEPLLKIDDSNGHLSNIDETRMQSLESHAKVAVERALPLAKQPSATFLPNDGTHIEESDEHLTNVTFPMNESFHPSSNVTAESD